MEKMKGYSGKEYSVCVCVWIAVRKAVVFREFPSEERKLIKLIIFHLSCCWTTCCHYFSLNISSSSVLFCYIYFFLSMRLEYVIICIFLFHWVNSRGKGENALCLKVSLFPSQALFIILDHHTYHCTTGLKLVIGEECISWKRKASFLYPEYRWFHVIVKYKPATCPPLPVPVHWVFNGVKLKCSM